MKKQCLISKNKPVRIITIKHAVWLLGLLLILTSIPACQFNLNPTPLPPLPTQEPVPTMTPAPPTATALPMPSATPQSSPTPLPTASPTHFIALEGSIQVLSMNMRSGPGTLHPIITKYKEGTAVSIVARAPGDEWLKVETTDFRVGWMLAIFLEIEGDITHLPVQAVTDSYIIHGRVTDTNGQPVDGINFAIFNVGSPNGQPRTEGATNDEGVFFAYLPSDSQGEWSVSLVGINCESSIMDADCNYEGQFTPSSRVISELPAIEPLTFVYQE
jgi:hypothetical protein